MRFILTLKMLIDLSREEIQARNRILAALLLSLVVHLVALVKFGSFSHSADSLQSIALTVRLVGPVRALPDLDMEAEARRPTSTTTRVSNDVEKIVPQVSELKLAEKPAEKPAGSRKIKQVAAFVVPDESQKGAAISAAPFEQSRQSSQAPGIPFPGVTSHVTHAEIEFKLLSGEESNTVGVIRHDFSTNSTQVGDSYTLNVVKVPENGEENQSDEWRLRVSGRANEKGLSARGYDLQGGFAARLFSLREVGAAQEKSQVGDRRGSTPDGILDRQSLLYHFSRQPPSFNGGGVWLADSVTHGYYRYRVVGFEQQQIAAQGSVRTLRLHLSETETGEFIELWLAPDMNYLPVRVRHVDRKGVVTEQIAISLSFN